MMPRRSHRGSGRRLRRKYAWHGFYQPTFSNVTSQALLVFVLYDPIDDDHMEQATLVRVRGFYTIKSTEVSIDGNIGMGIYYAQRDAAGAITTDIDPAGNTAFDIESNSTLWLRQFQFGDTDAANAVSSIRGEWDIKAKRKVEDPNWIILAVRADQSNDFAIAFNCRVLIDEGV